MSIPLDGLAIAEDKKLHGSKVAYRQGNTLFVSPAMLQLMRAADQDELQHLCENIRVVNLGPAPDFTKPLPPQFWKGQV